jgi:hypothetical protein
MEDGTDPDPAEILLGGALALLRFIATQAKEGSLPSEAVSKMTSGETPGSVQIDVDFQPDWRRLVDDAYRESEEDAEVAAAVSRVAERLPKRLREATPLPISNGSEDPSARVFCGFCEILCREATDAKNPGQIQGDMFGAAEAAATALDNFCEARHHRVVLTAPVSAVRLDNAARISIDESAAIAPVDEEARRKIWRRIGFDPHHMAGRTTPEPLAVWECEAAVEIAIDYEPGDFNTNWAPSQDLLDEIVQSLRLLSPGNVNWLALWPEIPGHEVFLKRFFVGGVSFPGPRPAAIPEPGAEPIAAHDLREVLGHLQRAQHWEGQEKHALDLALRRFSQTYGRWSSEDRLIDYWVAFEALFLPESDLELKYRAQMRIARFVGDSLEEREMIRKQLGESYALRSAIVHGSRSRKQTGDAIRTAAEETASTLRRALRRWIDPNFDGSPEGLDRGLLS